MTSIKQGSVVVGVDGSDQSNAALVWAVAYAVLASRPLVVVHAAGGLTAGELLGGPLESKQIRRERGARVVEQAVTLVGNLAPGLEMSDLVVVGDAREILLSLSQEAAMVVVGTRGRGAVRALLLGSVSLAVTSHALCSVAVVRSKVTPFANVAVGLSCDGSDRVPLEFAAGIASAEGVSLDAVHVWRAVDSLENLLSPAQRLETRALHERALSESLAGVGEKFPDVQVFRHLAEGRIAETLVKTTAAADCLVVGSRDLVGARMVGSVSRSVVEHASATVVVVRD